MIFLLLRGGARRQFDEFHAKRTTEYRLRFFKHNFKSDTALRTHHLFRNFVTAERLTPLLVEEREPD
jgi:hypothetical protein